MTQNEVVKIIETDQWMMKVLRAARILNLPAWMIGAGFVRNKVWDYLHGFEDSGRKKDDIDLIYFDNADLSEDVEKGYDQKLNTLLAANWSTKNQARMHIKHKRPKPYKNSLEALSEWVETATCVAVRLNSDDGLTLFAPHGVDDLVNLIIHPCPAFINNPATFWERVNSKNWQRRWPKLIIEK